MAENTRQYKFHQGKFAHTMRVLFPLFAIALTIMALRPGGSGDMCISVSFVLFTLVVILGLSFNHRTHIDFDRGWVHRKTTGLWGVAGPDRTYGFDEFDQVYVKEDEGMFELCLTRGHKKLRLTWGGQELREEGATLARLMRLPLDHHRI